MCSRFLFLLSIHISMGLYNGKHLCSVFCDLDTTDEEPISAGTLVIIVMNFKQELIGHCIKKNDPLFQHAIIDIVNTINVHTRT